MKVIREDLWEEVALVEDPGNKDQLESPSGGMWAVGRPASTKGQWSLGMS